MQREILGTQSAPLAARAAREQRVLKRVQQHRAAVIGCGGAVEDVVEHPRRVSEQFDVERLERVEILV